MRPGERLNAYSHAAGALLTLPAAALLLDAAAPHADGATVLGVAVFSLSALATYVASAAFHGSSGAARRWWARADHCAIHGLIAGTFTPFALTVLHGVAAWLLVGGVWAVAAAGIARECRASAGGAAPSVALYLAAGWLAVIAAAPIAVALHGASLAWLLAGALLYTLGTLFYRNVFGGRHAHGTWHLFVLGGTASHAMSLAALLGARAA